jgi:hypothetical protein
MTKKLEELFDLADFDQQDEGEVEVKTEIAVHQEQIQALDATLDKIDSALPSVRDINTSDEELDHLAKLAEDGFSELMELGMNVEPMRGSEIFSTASSLLGHAISAKNSKIDKKLKIVQLQIQKARLDLAARKLDGNEPTEGEARELDRNDILAAILEQKNSDK